MEKDFNKWNEKKKEFYLSGENKFYRPRDIWWCSMGINIGVESDGKGGDYGRPVLILRGFNKESFLGVVLTGKKRRGRYYIYLGVVEGREASANLSQIRLFDTKRLVNKMTKLNEEKFDKIRKTVKDLL